VSLVFQGTSLAALVELASAHDYVLVETTLYNAFFVRKREYEEFLNEIVPDTSIEALHETTMGTSTYQLYDGTLKLWGCKRMLWHRLPLEENKLQMLPVERRIFPFAPSSSAIQEQIFDISQVVDVSPYCQSTTDFPNYDIQKCAFDLYTQLQANGFCLIRGTGIDPSLCQRALEATHDFLQDAEETVRRSCLAADRARRGYAPMNVENFSSLLGEQGPNDLVRKFRVGPLRARWVDNTSSNNALLQENIWPPINLWDKAPAFQATVESYYEAACAAAQGVVRAMCDGLLQAHPDLQASLQPLLGGSEQSTSILTLLGYSSGTRHKGKNKSPLVAAHTDVGVVTMLLFDGGSRTCAQLQRSDGRDGWVDVELPSEVPSDPIFVLNVADCLSDLSWKRLPSTLHRVVARPKSTIPRNCCALFVGLDSATHLLIDNNETISYEEWRRRRIAKAQMVLRPNGSKNSNLRDGARAYP
jgi:isopenicillin N synthase-like dioxygenase